MRIAVVADAGSLHTPVWVSGLTARGHEVRVFSPHRHAPVPELHTPVRAPLWNGATSGVPAREAARSPMPLQAPPAFSSITRAVRLAPALRAWLSDFAPDRVIALRMQPEGYLACLGGRRPVGVVGWGQDVLRFSFAHPIHRWASRMVVRAASRVWGETQPVLAAFERLGARGGQCGMAMTGIDAAFWRRPPGWTRRDAPLEWRSWLRDDATVILSPRAVAREGRQLALVEAWSRRGGSSVLVLAGPGDAAVRAETSARARGRLVDLGTLEPARLRQLYWASDVAASLWKPDGLSQTLLEMMAAGVVPLAADLEGTREWIEPGVNGVLVDPDDGAALDGAVHLALTDDALRLRCREENVRLVERRADRRSCLARWAAEVERMEGVL